MEAHHLRKLLYVLGVAGVMTTSGCATALVRSKSTVGFQHVFPATAFDGQFFFKAGVKGDPLFAMVDPKEKNTPVARLAYCVGSIIDLPFSVAFDTILFPIDLMRGGTLDEDHDSKFERDGPANGSQPTRSETNRKSSAAGSRR